MEDLMRMALTNAFAAGVLGTIVAGLALILSRRPAVVHCLWVVVLLKLVTPPLFEVPVGLFEPEEALKTVVVSFEADPDVDMDMDGTAFEADFEELAREWTETEAAACVPAGSTLAAEPSGPSWSELAWTGVGAIWIGGSLTTLALAGYRILRFQRRVLDADPAGYLVEQEVEELSAAMGLKRPPLVAFIDARVTPMLWGLGARPRLILPRMLWKGLDGRSRTLLLAHELAHLKRGDHLLRFFELAVTVLYWWLPVVWWVRRALRDVEEQCCDAWVVWMFPDDARAYAETLLDTVDFLNPNAEPEPLLASGFGKVRHLRKRLTMVMKRTTSRTLGWKGSLGALALAGVLLPLSPTLAQKTEEASVTFEAEPIDGQTVTFRAVVDDAEVKTVDVLGPTANAAFTVGDVVFRSVDDEADKDKADKEKDKADKEKDKADKDRNKAEIRKEIRIEARGDGAEAIKEAIEKLKAKIHERLQDKKLDGKADEAQLKALISQLEQLDKLDWNPMTVRSLQGHPIGDQKPADVLRFNVDPIFPPHAKSDDPKVNEARKQVEELRQVMNEKQKELSELGKKLGEAHRKLAELQGGRIILQNVSPEVAERAQELRARRLRNLPRVELRAVEDPAAKGGEKDKDEARIDSLEQKLDKVLKELENLKAPRTEAEGEDEK